EPGIRARLGRAAHDAARHRRFVPARLAAWPTRGIVDALPAPRPTGLCTRGADTVRCDHDAEASARQRRERPTAPLSTLTSSARLRSPPPCRCPHSSPSSPPCRGKRYAISLGPALILVLIFMVHLLSA